MRNPRRPILRLWWLASLAACASARPAFDVRPVNDGVLSARWPEVLRTRYQCADSVVAVALRAVRDGQALESRFPIDSDQGKAVCQLAGVLWPVRVRAFETDAGLVEEWEFRGPLPQRGRPAIDRNDHRTWSAFFEGATPPELRLARLSPG